MADGRMSMAVLVHNAVVVGGPTRVVLSISDLGLDSPAGYLLTDLYHDNAVLGIFYPGQSLSVTVPPLDFFFFKATVNQA